MKKYYNKKIISFIFIILLVTVLGSNSIFLEHIPEKNNSPVLIIKVSDQGCPIANISSNIASGALHSPNYVYVDFEKNNL